MWSDPSSELLNYACNSATRESLSILYTFLLIYELMFKLLNLNEISSQFIKFHKFIYTSLSLIIYNLICELDLDENIYILLKKEDKASNLCKKSKKDQLVTTSSFSKQDYFLNTVCSCMEGVCMKIQALRGHELCSWL